MKITIVASVAILGTHFISFANAATGAPSIQETGGAACSQSAPIDMNRSDAGSYARYLMLNGTNRRDAIELARYVDHSPSTSTAQRSESIESENSGVGSYARYLMLNGKSREDAIQLARNIDRETPPRAPAQAAAM